MHTCILPKDRLKDFLASLTQYTLWAPVHQDTGTCLAVIEDRKSIETDLRHQVKIPKEAIFPQTEQLFTFNRDGMIHDMGSPATKESIIFGIRPCEARSFLILDPVFAGSIPDPYYQNRRSRTLLIGLSCPEPFPNCFCTSLGGGPFSQAGLDLLFTELDGKFFIEVITEKGEKIVKETGSLFIPASAEDSRQKEALAQTSAGKMKRHIDLQGIPEKLATIFDHPIWKQMALKCIGCGICTYTCPTCYCFDIQDETTLRKGRRVRVWDSCMFGEYTLHASGHNPRPTRAERLKNRIYHKFKFNVDNFGMVGCVGCGRCISLCPANEDLIENLSALKSIE